MDVLITWLCLGGGAAMILVGLVTITRLQARTGREEDDGPDAEP